jgi:hypothetical protein
VGRKIAHVLKMAGIFNFLGISLLLTMGAYGVAGSDYALRDSWMDELISVLSVSFL